MPKEIKIYLILPQKNTDKDALESSNTEFPLKDIFQLIYHSSLLGGVILSILYFTFSAEVFPSIDNISQLATYIIAVFSVAFFFVIYFSATIIAPSLITIDKQFDGKKFHIIGYLAIISLGIILFLTTLITYDSRYSVFFLVLPIPITQQILNWCFNGKWNDLKSTYIWSILISYIILSSFFSFIILTSIINSSIDFITILLISLSLQLMFFIPNTILIYNFELFLNFKSNAKKIFYLTLLILFTVFTSISLVFKAVNKSNPIIISPFSILKLGHYKAELHFKEDFIKKHPSFVADANSTYNTFSVLSSIGDEYVIKKTSTFTVIHSENNETNVSQIQSGNKMYWYNENNHSVVWNTPDLKSIEKNSLTLTKITQEIDNSNQNKNYRMYRIKKENIDFPVVGDEINLQLTKLRDNADF